MEVILFKKFSLTLPYKGDEAEGAWCPNGGVVNIATKTGRSQILAVKGGAWVIIGEGMGACQSLKSSEEMVQK